MASFFNYGRDLLYDFQSASAGTFRWMLLQDTYVFSADDHYVADIVADECNVAGYARVNAAGRTRTVNLSPTNTIKYDCDDVDFGTPAVGNITVGMALFKFVTNDADSILIAYHAFGDDIPTNGSDFIVVVHTNGVAVLA